MSFEHPQDLWLLSLALPILAFHFYRGRVRRMPVPTLLFWEQVLIEEERRTALRRLRHVASLLLNLKLHPDQNHAVLFEALALGNNLPAEEFIDSHGNHVCRVTLAPGTNCFRHDAIVMVSSRPDNHGLLATRPQAPGELPAALLRYTLPSRYCDADKLTDFAWSKFGHIEHGLPRVSAISRWLHANIEYRYMSGRTDLSAWDVLQRGYGVCRDFAHLAIALNRTFNLPARYVTGHLPDIGCPDPDSHMDFHAYAEVYIG